MSQHLDLRPERPADVPVIAAVIAAAFLGHPHSDQTEQFIVAGLRRADVLSLSLVAEAEGRVVGHAAFSPVIISDGSEGWFGLGPLSVEPRLQGQGVGQALVQRGLELLGKRGAQGCVVLGAPAYYRRFGFEATPGLTFEGAPAEFFMALRFAGPLPRGEAAYHAAFSARA